MSDLDHHPGHNGYPKEESDEGQVHGNNAVPCKRPVLEKYDHLARRKEQSRIAQSRIGLSIAIRQNIGFEL